MNEKTYRYLVVGLLAVIAIILALPILTPEPVDPETGIDRCEIAVTKAEALIDINAEIIDLMFEEYEDAVYNRADNINQQNLLAQESQFLALNIMVQQLSALLNVSAHCS